MEVFFKFRVPFHCCACSLPEFRRHDRPNQTFIYIKVASLILNPFYIIKQQFLLFKLLFYAKILIKCTFIKIIEVERIILNIYRHRNKN